MDDTIKDDEMGGTFEEDDALKADGDLPVEDTESLEELIEEEEEEDEEAFEAGDYE